MTALRNPLEVRKRVLVAMSGGVDSAVTAALLRTQGYDVLGLHMTVMTDDALQNLYASEPGAENSDAGPCMRTRQKQRVQKICDLLEIPLTLEVIDQRFEAEIKDYVVHEYLRGRKPSPCVRCNGTLKFDVLYKKSLELKCDFIATGHYAKVLRSQDGGVSYLYKAADSERDQTYLLFGVEQKILARTLMPLGDLLWANVEKLALTFGLDTSGKPARMSTCFVGEKGYKAWVKDGSTDRFTHMGHIVDQKAKIWGRHDGIYRHFVGQNEGLKILNPDNHKEDLSHYVLGFDLKLNAVIVGPQSELMQKALAADECKWVGSTKFFTNLKVKAKIASTAPEAACRIQLQNNDSVIVEFEEPQYGITPGQAIVFYLDEQVLGGGFIVNLKQPVRTAARNLKDFH